MRAHAGAGMANFAVLAFWISLGAVSCGQRPGDSRESCLEAGETCDGVWPQGDGDSFGEDVPFQCPGPCDDWFTCTRDSCDPKTGRCIFEGLAESCEEPRPETQVSAGPYLQYAVQTEATVMWETPVACAGAVLVEVEGSNQWVLYEEELSREIHEITLGPLIPGTSYRYRVRPCANDWPMPVGWDFETFPALGEAAGPPESAQSYTFAVWGDSQEHPEVLTSLASMIWEGGQTRFAVVVGDVVSDGFQREQWRELLLGPISVFAPHIPFFVAIGDHEGKSDWFYNYLHQPEPETYFAFTFGVARFVVLNGVREFSTFDPQGPWLAQETESEAWKQALYRFVFFHEMPITNLWGHDNYDREPFILSVLMPQLEDKGVDVLFTGHAHCYERGYLPGGLGMTLVVTGGGGGSLDTVTSGDWSEITVEHSAHHYTSVAVGAMQAEVTAIGLDGELLDRFVVMPHTLP